MIAPLIETTLECCRSALRKAKLDIKDIDRAILVGGSSRLAIVQRRLAEEFERDFEFDENMADLCVAIGAALYARATGVEAGGFRLDPIPGETSDTEIIVAGTVLPTDEAPSVAKCVVTLNTGGADEKQTADTDGGFFFEAALEPDATTDFDLRAATNDGAEIAHHAFSVVHNAAADDEGDQPPAAAELGEIPTYLAKNLCVDTTDQGLMQVAEEGQPLPIDVEVGNLETSGIDSTEVSLELYQEDQHIVQILLKNFTKPVPQGTPVKLTIHVGKDYSMNAEATIPSVGATAEARDIKIPAPPRPKVAHLESEFATLKQNLAVFLDNFPTGEDKMAIGTQADKIVAEVETLFKSPERDVYRIQRLLRNLDRLIKENTAGFFKPSRSEMDDVFSATRALLAQAQERDQSLKRQDLGRTLDVLRAQADEAYQQRDRRGWARVAKRVGEMRAGFEQIAQGGGAPDLPEAPMLRMMIEQYLTELEGKASSSGKLSDPAVQQALREARTAVRAVDVSSGDAQTRLVAVIQGPVRRLITLVEGEAASPDLPGGVRTSGGF